jgi:hypothetical protein
MDVVQAIEGVAVRGDEPAEKIDLRHVRVEKQ